MFRCNLCVPLRVLYLVEKVTNLDFIPDNPFYIVERYTSFQRIETGNYVLNSENVVAQQWRCFKSSVVKLLNIFSSCV